MVLGGMMDKMSRYQLFLLAAILITTVCAQVSKKSLQGRFSRWSRWSSCSRSCGGGVSFRSRTCESGECNQSPEDNIEYRMCSIQDCPEGSLDFRMEQCSAHDGKKYRGKYYRWTSFNHGSGECELKCMPKNENFYVTFAKKVTDGTRCNDESLDVCINGTCTPVGCDMQLYSGAKKDRCGVCNGDGSSCKRIEGSYKLEQSLYDYVDVVTIPSGATSVRLYEEGKPKNYIALADRDNKFLLNGGYQIQNPGFKKLKDFNLKYERSTKNEIFIEGPLTYPIQAKILAFSPGRMFYEYYMPHSSSNQPDVVTYEYRNKEWGLCSKKCAGGTRTRLVYCARSDNGQQTQEYNCAKLVKPIEREVCNRDPCKPSWFISEWSSCSKTCGIGQRTRRVHCLQSVDGGESKMVDENLCPGSTPESVENCFEKEKCPSWKVGGWGECSRTCGRGVQIRSVSCVDVDTANSVDADSCDVKLQPLAKRECTNAPCGARWNVGEWTKCSSHCGVGMRSRRVQCLNIEGQPVPDSFCDAGRRPDNIENCQAAGPCKPVWHATQWSNCTGKCGHGVEMRMVVCAEKINTDTLYILDDDVCEDHKKPPLTRPCVQDKPCYVNYFVSDWRACSTTCGVGYQHRQVTCYADTKVDHSEKHCKDLKKPEFVRLCRQKRCEGEVVPVTDAPIRTTVFPTRRVREEKAPTITSFSGSETLHVGDNADYQCVVVGYPKPQVTWQLDGRTLSGNRFQSYAVPTGSRLVVLAAAREDRGRLECVARNRNGVARAGVAIRTSAPPQVRISPDSAFHEEGDTITITCTPIGTHTPTIVWRKDNRRYFGDRRVSVSDGRVVIRDALVGDSGSYQCQAYNDAGSVTVQSNINVQRKKRPVKEDCIDNNQLADCPTIKRLDFCGHPYYRQVCCRTCNQ